MTEQYLITIVTMSDIMPGSGESMPGVADSDSRYDAYGLPYMNAKTLKGHLREQMELLLHIAPDRYEGVSVESLLGASDLESRRDAARIRLSSLTVPAAIRGRVMQEIDAQRVTAEEIAYALSDIRYQTRIGNGGVAADGSLRQIRLIRKGLQFTAILEADDLREEERRFLQDAVRAIQHIGTGKSKGLGTVASHIEQVSAADAGENGRTGAPGNAALDGSVADQGADTSLAAGTSAVSAQAQSDGRTLLYEIRIVEPVKAGGSGAQNNAESLSYIPGSMMRGGLIGRLLRSGACNNDDVEHILQTVRFSDVLPMAGGEPLFTCPSIYYADKHVLREAERTGEELKAHVRAPRVLSDLHYVARDGESNPAIPQEGELAIGRGRYASLRDGLALYSVRMTGNLHVSVKAGRMYRYEAIAPGQTYTGTICCEDGETAALLGDALTDAILYLGGSRGSGYGRCEVMRVQRTEMTSEAERYGIHRKAENHILPIYALSNLILLDENGEETSIIDPALLEQALGITNVQWQRSYTSIHNVNGYNHTWRAGQVQRTAVAAGSILYYTYEGELEDDRAAALEERGVGLRREDGYGRILVAPDLSGGREEVTVHQLQPGDVRGEIPEPQDGELQTLQHIESRINGYREDLAIREAALDYIGRHGRAMRRLTPRQRMRLCSLLERLPQGDRGRAQREIRAFVGNLKNTAGSMYAETVLKYRNGADCREISMRALLDMLCDDDCSLEEFAGQEIPIPRLVLVYNTRADQHNQERERTFYNKAAFLRLALYDLTREEGRA